MRPGKFQLMLSEKLQPSVLVVPHDQDTSRLYMFHSATKDYSVRYYRCSMCKRLSRQSPVPGRSFHVLVKIRTYQLETGNEAHHPLCSPVRNAQLETGNETHHPLCSPIRNAQIRATEIHRSCKLLAKEGVVTAKAAFEQAVTLAATEGHSILAQLGTWKQVRTSYFDAAAQGRNTLKRLNNHVPHTTGK